MIITRKGAVMIELKKHEYNLVRPILEQTPFNTLMAEAVAGAMAPGRIYADRREQPRSCLISHSYGMSFLLGYSDDKDYRERLPEYLRNSGKERRSAEMLQVYPEKWSDLLNSLKSAGEVKEWGRVNFTFREERFPVREAPSKGKPETVMIDRHIFENFQGTVIPKFFWNSAEEFLEKGAGFCVKDNGSGKAAGIAFSSCLWPPFLEIGVETAKEHRGKGVAFKACRRMIAFCLENHLEPVWSCKKENTPSFQLALKLGFEEKCSHPYYELPFTPA